MTKENHNFKVGDKVNFTDVRHHIGKVRHSIQYKTVHGSIVSINDKNVATIKLNRSKNERQVHLGNLSPDGEPSALTQAFLDAVRESNQIAAECDKAVCSE